MKERASQWRNDAVEKALGQATFTTDVGLPGMLHGKILRSPHAHARIRRVDGSRALSLPGVVAVVSGDDLSGLNPFYGLLVPDQPVLAIGKVRYVGDTVAAVCAEDEATAFEALKLIDVEYTLLPSVMSMEAALAAGAPLLFEQGRGPADFSLGRARMITEPDRNVLFEYSYDHGDVVKAFSTCDHVFEDCFGTNRVDQFHLEPYVTVAHAKQGSLDVWAGNQDPFDLRKDLSHIFGIPLSNIRIRTNYVGGGFGGKSFCKMEPVAVLLSQKANRPVRLCLSMDEAFHTVCKPETIITLKTGVMADGTLVARQCDLLVNGGAYSDVNAAVAMKAGYRVGGPYRWKALKTRSRAIRTNTIPGGSFRGFGGTQATFASDSQIDMIARRLGVDPYKMRMQNLLRLNEPFLPNDRPIDSDLRHGLEVIAERLGYDHRPRMRGRGVGLSVGLKDGAGMGTHGHSLIKVATDGSIVVHSGTVEIGQGAGMAACLIASEILNAPVASARYGGIDTDHTLLDAGTRGSSGIVLAGKAVELAALNLKSQVLSFAAKQLGCRPEELTLVNWAVNRGNEQFSMKDLIAKQFGPFGYDFVSEGFVQDAPDEKAPLGHAAGCWIPNWVGAEVSVDEETGKARLNRLVVAGDAGRAINLSACRGQLQGAAIQAFGMAMLEHVKYEGDNPITATPMTYRVPLASDVPEIFEAIVFEQGMGNGPFGAKGLGEAGMLAVASAIANAVEDAVGVRVTDLPISPEKILMAIERRNSANLSADG